MAYEFTLITGATSGIGEAFARELPSGTGLLLTGRDGARLSALQAELGGDGRRVETVTANLATEAGRRAVISAAADLPVDLLINNAGLGRFGALLDNPPETEREMAEVNVVAPLVLTRALLPAMLERARERRRRAGVIIVASTAAFAPLPYLATYAATKAFDLYLAEGLAEELADEPADVLALCPGPTRTNFHARANATRLPSPGMVGAQRVAREGLNALGRRTVHVIGGGNQAYTALTRLLPRRMLRRSAGQYMRRSVSQVRS